jgi:biotin carboxyl carrier protein
MIKYRATLHGKVYDVLVEELNDSKKAPEPRLPTAALPLETAAMSLGPAPHVLVAASKTPGAPVANDAGAVLSPLAGKIVSIDVDLGEKVEEGAQVATIEAMKMNTYIFAPVGGAVASINANSGDAVEEGALILRIG